MKEKKKGFTLIELLAVIVILAIIALIVTPIVLNLINTVKKGAFSRSTEGILQSAKLYYSSSLLDIEESKDISFWCDNKICVSDKTDKNGNQIKLEVDGKMGIGEVNVYSDGTISLSLSDGTYCAEKEQEEEKVSVSKRNCIKDKLENKTYTTGDAVVIGGYNWHVIGDTGTEVTLLMDAGQVSNMKHCTGNTNASPDCGVDETGTHYIYSWDKSLIREYLNGAFLTNLESKISNEIVPTSICVDSSRGDGGTTYGGYLMSELDAIGKSCSAESLSYKVRLISESEYRNMTPYYQSIDNNVYPNIGNIKKISSDSDYASWLYCNSSSCGNSAGMWWTMSSFSGIQVDARYVRYVRRVTNLGDIGPGTGVNFYGVRPVITIIK